MPAPSPYRLYDAEHGCVITSHERAWMADEATARAAATKLIEADEYTSIEIQHLEDGLFGYDYYRVDTIEHGIEW
ncbi:MAG: hypothetical protein IT165_25220 [Bryobacterales bacterium]|nr:hypothetical protein [Bryobacterales bacterium]